MALHVQLRSALRAKFLNGLVEDFRVHREPIAKNLGILEVAGEHPRRSIQIIHRGIIPLEEAFVDTPIGVAVQQDRARRKPVAPRAADLLVVRLHRTRQRRVHDGADVRLVDPHPKGDGRDNHLELPRLKLALHPLACARFQSRMVSRGRELPVELARQLIGCFARWRIDDGRPRRRTVKKLRDKFRALRL